MILCIFSVPSILTFGPVVVSKTLIVFYGINVEILGTLADVMVGLSGFASALVCFFQRIKSMDSKRTSLESLESRAREKKTMDSMSSVALDGLE